jgi:hypothetical protein
MAGDPRTLTAQKPYSKTYNIAKKYWSDAHNNTGLDTLWMPMIKMMEVL